MSGDKILLSGPIGDHGITILLARGELDLEADLRSDTRSVLPLVETLIRAAGAGHSLDARSNSRRGCDILNELARDCGLGMVLFEDQIPVRDTVRGACELLGLDPLHIANEGQFLAVVSPEYADAAINALSLAPGGERSPVIGEVREQPAGTVLVTTLYGGSRIVDMLVGDPLAAHLLRTDMTYGHAHGNSPARSKSDCWSGTCCSSSSFAGGASPGGGLPRNVRAFSSRRPVAGLWARTVRHRRTACLRGICSSRIVGKRALPALDLSILFRPWMEAILRPEDIVMGFGPPEGDPEVWATLQQAHLQDAMTFALPGEEGSYGLDSGIAGSVHAPGDDRNPLPHAVGDRACLLRAPRTGA